MFTALKALFTRLKPLPVVGTLYDLKGKKYDTQCIVNSVDDEGKVSYSFPHSLDYDLILDTETFLRIYVPVSVPKAV